MLLLLYRSTSVVLHSVSVSHGRNCIEIFAREYVNQ